MRPSALRSPQAMCPGCNLQKASILQSIRRIRQSHSPSFLRPGRRSTLAARPANRARRSTTRRARAAKLAQRRQAPRTILDSSEDATKPGRVADNDQANPKTRTTGTGAGPTSNPVRVLPHIHLENHPKPGEDLQRVTMQQDCDRYKGKADALVFMEHGEFYGARFHGAATSCKAGQGEPVAILGSECHVTINRTSGTERLAPHRHLVRRREDQGRERDQLRCIAEGREGRGRQSGRAPRVPSSGVSVHRKGRAAR